MRTQTLFRVLFTLFFLTPLLHLQAGMDRPRCKSPERRVAKMSLPPTDCDSGGTVINNAYNPTELYEIPVVVHIIHASDGTGQLSANKIAEMMEILNQDFRALAGTSSAQGNDVMVQFYLAEQDPQGSSTSGITYTENDDWFEERTEAVRAEYGEALAWDTTKYLNIYVTGTQDALGYVVYMPWEQGANPAEEGVTMAYDAVGINSVPGAEDGHTISHEVGHYLGLEHTFGFGDDCPTGDCYTTGDYICDTNPHREANGGCSDTQSCGVSEPIHNYMNYTDDSCMYEFTNEQINRMRCTLTNYRSGLIQNRTEPPAELPERWIAHVPRIGGEFTGSVFVKNLGASNGNLTLTGYDNTGATIEGAEATLSATAGGFATTNFDDLFDPPSADLSHIGITGDSHLSASFSYRVAEGDGASAHLNEASNGATSWYFFPGESDYVFEGLAVLNVGDAAAEVTMTLENANGTTAETATVSESLAPGAKALAVLALSFTDVAGKVVKVSATQPVLIVALRGTQPGGDVTYLYQTVPIRGQ